MAVKVYDKATQQVVEVDPATAAEGIAAGTFEPAQAKLKVTRAGQTGTVDATQLANARGHGWELSDDEGVAAARERIEAHSVAGQAQGTIEAALAGATLGASSVALEALGMDPRKMAARREASGIAGTAAELTGAIAPAFFTGGASLGASTGRGLAATVLRNTPAGLATRGAASLGRGLELRVGMGAARRILPAGARNFVEGAAQGAGAQLDENVLGDRELNADLLMAGSMGGLFGTGAGAAVPGLAKVAGGTLRAPVRGMRGVLGRMNAATGGFSTREIAEYVARKTDGLPEYLSRKVDELPGYLERKAAELPEMWRANAVREGLDEGTALRIKGMMETSEGNQAIARLERDSAKIDREAAELVTTRVNDVHARLREVQKLATGEAKFDNWSRLMSADPAVHRAAAHAIDDLFVKARNGVDDVIRRNADDLAKFGATTHSAPVLKAADEAVGRLHLDITKIENMAQRKLISQQEKITRKAAAIDSYKRRLGGIVEENGGWGAMRMASPEVRATNGALRRMYGEAKELLERDDLFGGAALAQKEQNAAYVALSQADDLFEEAAKGTGLASVVDADGTINAAKALKLVRAHGRVGGDVTVARLMDAMDARVAYLKKIEKSIEDPTVSGSVRKVEKDVADLRAEFKRQAVDAGKLDDLREARRVQGSGSPSLFTTATSFAGLMGFGVGGVPGAVVAAGLVAARQPYTTLHRYAAIRNALDKHDIRLSETIRKMINSEPVKLAKAGGRAAIDAAKAGAKKAGEAASAAGKAIGRGARATGRAIQAGGRATERGLRVGAEAGGSRSAEAERQQRHETALAKAIEMSSSPEAIERALTVPHYDIHDVAPALAGVMQQRVHKASVFLASKAPKVYSRPGSKVKLVDPVAAASFERYLEAVTDPIGALARFSQGRITGETAEAIRIVYPALYADIQDRIQTELADAAADGRELPYATRIKLGLLFQTPTDPSLSGPVAMEIQTAIGASFDEPDAAAVMAGANAPNPSGKPKAGKIDRETTPLQTSGDRSASWRSIA